MPTLVSTAQLTIIDQNDYIFSGTTPPPNPIVNVTMWIDTSVKPSLQKRWTGTEWEVVNEVNVGGRNLVKNSNKFRLGSVATGITTSITTEGYLQIIAAAGNYNWLSSWYDADSNLSFVESTLKEGDDFTISFEIKSPNAATPPTIYIKSGMGYYGMVGSVATEFTKIYYTGKWKSANSIAPNLGFASAIGTYIIKNWQLEKGNKPTDWKLSQEDIDSAIADAKLAGTNAQNTANTAKQAVGNLNNYVDGAFKDGVIDTAEAKAIDKLSKQVNIDFDKAINDYNVVYANAYLTGSAKTDLLNSKVTLAGAKDNLQNSINTAIADGKTTAAEKADVDSKFATYKNAFTDYQTKLSNASKAVQMELDRLAGVKVDGLQIGGANLVENGNFENGRLYNFGWTNGGVIQRDTSTSYEGAACLKGTNIDSSSNYVTVFTRDRKQGDTLTISGWVKADQASILSIVSVKFDWGWNSNKTYTLQTNTWTRFVFTYTIGDARNCIMLGVPTGVLWLDMVMLEEGNKASTFRPSQVDIKLSIDEAKQVASTAQADAITAKARTEGMSGFKGGLAFANLLKLMPLGATVESAGMNGQPTDAAGASLPAVYAGGDFAQAIAGVCNLIFKHNGDGKVGDFYVDSNGTVCVKENDVNKVIITRGVISSLAQLFGSSTSGSVANAADSCNVDGTTTKIFTNKLVVANNNTSVTVKSNLTAHADGLDNNAIGNCFVKLCLINEVSGAEILLDRVSAYCNRNIDSKSVAVNKTLLLSSGTYALKVDYINRTTNNAYLEGGVWETTISWYYTATAQRTEIGKNGFATIADISNFIYAALEPDGFKLMIRGTGNKIDIPGILATGSVSSGAADSNKWGAKSSGDVSVKLGTGRYRVYHNVGKLGYTVGLTSTTDSVDARCVGKGNNYIDVNCRNSSNVLVDASFDYELHGDNQ